MPSLNTTAKVTLAGEEFSPRARVVTHHSRVRVFSGKQTLLDEQFTSMDKLNRKNWNITLEDGRLMQITGQGCGCGGRQ